MEKEIHLVLYAARREEGKKLQQAIRARAAVIDWDVDCQLFHRAAEAAEYLRAEGATAICWDMTGAADRIALSQVRPHCQQAYLLVLAGPETSPLAFLNPSIAPSSLVIRPLSAPELQRAARELLDFLRRSRQTPGQPDSECLTVTWRDGQQRIPYTDIYYFEARDRRLYARLRGEEIAFSGTLEKLEEDLPSSFQRCHRSFIVNRDQIERVMLSQNLIALWDGLTVPLSRSYKKAIKNPGVPEQTGEAEE